MSSAAEEGLERASEDARAPVEQENSQGADTQGLSPDGLGREVEHRRRPRPSGLAAQMPEVRARSPSRAMPS